MVSCILIFYTWLESWGSELSKEKNEVEMGREIQKLNSKSRSWLMHNIEQKKKVETGFSYWSLHNFAEKETVTLVHAIH